MLINLSIYISATSQSGEKINHAGQTIRVVEQLDPKSEDAIK
jgi:hypothetical protein